MKKLSFIAILPLVIGCWLGPERSPKTDKGEMEAEIGHYLFFDKRLSFNNTKSCASCHDPQLAFTDGYHRSIGANGDIHKRNAPTLLNLADNRYFTYADSSIRSIHDQVQIPLFNRQFIELGSGLKFNEILNAINRDPLYQRLFKKIGIDSCSMDQLSRFIEAYCLRLVSRKSRFDLVMQGKAQFSAEEKNGYDLFIGPKLKCGSCHGGIDLDQPVDSSTIYANNGFFEKDSSHVKRNFNTDWGLFELTRNESDKGKFRIPSLRNCLITAPYMHDGSVSALDTLIKIYSKGGRSDLNVHPSIRSFELNPYEQRNLLLFLQALTDTGYLSHPYFCDPFKLPDSEN